MNYSLISHFFSDPVILDIIMFAPLQCLGPRKRSPYPAIRHMPDTCTRPYALVCGHAGCALWDLTHRSQFIKAPFSHLGILTPEVTTTFHRGVSLHDNFAINCSLPAIEQVWRSLWGNFDLHVLPCTSKYRLSLQYTHSRTVRSPSHLKLELSHQWGLRFT